MTKHLTAIVPVRKGSQRVKHKNIKRFYKDKSLLQIKLEQLQKVKAATELIDNIIVTSDDEEALDIAEEMGIEIHERDPYYASSECTNSEFFENLATVVQSSTDYIVNDFGKTIESDSNKIFYAMYSPVTCPLISFETYKDVLKRWNKRPDNYVTSTLIKHHMWEQGNPLNYNIHQAPNSQDLPDIDAITYGISIISIRNMREYKNIVTNKPVFIRLDEIESTDIDTEYDFMVAQHVYAQLNN